MLAALNDPIVKQILSRSGNDPWRDDFQKIEHQTEGLSRHSGGEAGTRAIQRMLIFLGYSTSSSGAFVVDGDFGRGTNRGIAQFQYEHGLARHVERPALCYACSFQTARKRIVAIPDTHLDLRTLKKLLSAAQQAMDSGQVMLGDVDEALFHLNALQSRRLLNCREIQRHYGAQVRQAVSAVNQESDVAIRPEWILSIIKQETSGIVRPRFEQHKLSKFNAESPEENFSELRLRAMSIGLGQIMGFNHHLVGAPSARAMLYSPLSDQVRYVARFIARKKTIVAKADPDLADFRAMARFYNGPAYATHFYHERLQTWFNEFKSLQSPSSAPRYNPRFKSSASSSRLGRYTMKKGISLHIGLNFVDPDHYGGWDGELAACENDAQDMAAIAGAQGFEAAKLIREQATREAVTAKLTAAAGSLASGDILLVSYSGHGGQVPDMNLDEDDDMDETWCLYNGQLMDDELLAIWAKFEAGVRILVISDSCHSGTVTREVLSDPQQYTDLTPRFAPSDVMFRTYEKNRAFYDRIAVKTEEVEPVQATVRLISGCQDNQYSYDGTFNGQFTGKLKRVWRNGAFEGDYAQFHDRILRLLPAHQTPNHLVFGMFNPEYDAEKPFTIG